MHLTYEDKASIKLDRQQKNINPVNYAVWVLCSKMCTEFRSWVWRISKTECIPVGPVDASLGQQLINKAIDGRQRWNL